MSADPSAIAQIVKIIRRDLKLGPEIALAPETVLFGGELDLDSLDALLLVQSIEKDFGIKVPTDAIGPEIFATLGTLAKFVEQQTSEQASA
jgi:3-hydroxyacyl-[acyl-carrier-protein] dehydratase